MRTIGQQLVENESRRRALYADARRRYIELVAVMSFAAPCTLAALDVDALRAKFAALESAVLSMRAILDEERELKAAAAAERAAQDAMRE